MVGDGLASEAHTRLLWGGLRKVTWRLATLWMRGWLVVCKCFEERGHLIAELYIFSISQHAPSLDYPTSPLHYMSWGTAKWDPSQHNPLLYPFSPCRAYTSLWSPLSLLSSPLPSSTARGIDRRMVFNHTDWRFHAEGIHIERVERSAGSPSETVDLMD